MQKKLTCYYGLIERGTEGLVQEGISDALRLEPVVREILKRLDPELADVKIDPWSNWVKTIDAVDFALGIIAAREACAVELAADIAFSLDPPEPGRPRLRCPGDPVLARWIDDRKLVTAP